MSDFRFGELRERTLHRQLKSFFCPADGLTEVTIGKSIADIWSPTAGILEVQTGSLFKLRAKLPAYLESHDVNVIHPISARKTLVTWNAERSAVVSERLSPRKEKILSSFREIGTLAPWLEHPRFSLTLCLIHEREHRSDDGAGSWRRKGVSKVDRELVEVLEVRKFQSRADWEALLPPGPGPWTNRELAQALGIRLTEARDLTLCFKKAGWLAVDGLRGRETLLVRTSRRTATRE